MKGENPMAEDSFEIARKAFFGTGKTTPRLKASPAELSKRPNECKTSPPMTSQREIQGNDDLVAASHWVTESGPDIGII